MGARPGRLAGGGSGGIIVGTAEGPSVPALGNSGRTFSAGHSVCRLRLRTQARGGGTQSDSAEFQEDRRGRSLGRATGSTRPADPAFATQLQGTDRFSR